MEVSMSITRRGKYTNSNICINVQVRNVVCLFFLLYANLLVLVTLCEGNHYPFIVERYNNNFTSLCSTLHFYTISKPNSLIFRQNFFEKSSNGKSWVRCQFQSYNSYECQQCEEHWLSLTAAELNLLSSEAESPKNSMPISKVPIAPNPVQIIYAVLTGISL